MRRALAIAGIVTGLMVPSAALAQVGGNDVPVRVGPCTIVITLPMVTWNPPFGQLSFTGPDVQTYNCP